MDPFGRWSHQRLLEEVATKESSGHGPASRGGRSIAAAVLVTIIFVLIVILAGGDADEPAPPAPGTGVGQSVEIGDVVG